MMIEQGHEFFPWLPLPRKYYFHIIDLSVCFPIITPLQLRCEICSNSLTRMAMRSIGAEFANTEETHDEPEKLGLWLLTVFAGLEVGF